MPGVRTGTWYSASWRSCSPTGGPANSLGIVFPGGLRRHSHRSGAHTAAARRGARWTREVSQIVRIFYEKFLTLSKIAYTKFSAGPPDKHNPLSQQKEFRARTSLFKKRRICAFSSKILLHRLLQIRHLQVKILYPQPLTKRVFHPNIF